MNILQQSSINACVALGMTLVIISGGIDLSVGPTAAFGAVLSATLMVAGVPVFAVDRWTGARSHMRRGQWRRRRFRGLQPFIVTLGTLSTYRALLLNVQAFYQLLATGIIIILAMLIDRVTRGRE